MVSVPQAAGLSVNSSLSDAEVQPGSSGKSVLPSPSLSRPSEHCGDGRLFSVSSSALTQPGSSGKSTRPSPSLSMPSLHCGFLLLSLFPPHPNAPTPHANEQTTPKISQGVRIDTLCIQV